MDGNCGMKRCDFRDIVKIVNQKESLCEKSAVLLVITETVFEKQHGRMYKEDEEAAIEVLTELREVCKAIVRGEVR